MMSQVIPKPFVSRFVSQRSRLWWQDIGRSLMAFNEVEILVLDWAVVLSRETSWWKTYSSADLKQRVPLLRRALRQQGAHRLPAKIRAQVDTALEALSSLTDLRNELAHMRLRFGSAPTDDDSDTWVPDASHVEVITRKGGKPVVYQRDRPWIRSVAEQARKATAELQVVMLEVHEHLAGGATSRTS